MKYKDVIYTKLSDMLSIVIEELDKRLDVNESDVLTEVYENLQDVDDLLSNAYIGNDVESCVHQVKCVIGESSLDDNFPGWNELNKFTDLAYLIEGDGDFNINDTISIDPSVFKLDYYSGNKLPFNAFAHVNDVESRQSVGYFSFMQVDEQNRTCESGFNADFLAVLFYLLSQKVDLDFTLPVIIYRNDAALNSAESALKLLATFNGLVIHSQYSGSPSLASTGLMNKVCALNSYSQFEEVLVILSEVNSRDGLLEKFLNIYHVIESFMFKIPIVNLGQKNDRNIFSIRDFRRLYDTTSDKEPVALSKLFTDAEMGGFWERDLNSAKFKDLVLSGLDEVEASSDFDSKNYEPFIQKINLNGVPKYSDLRGQLSGKKYSQFLYSVRNAIVHNKETEFHLSHFNLDDSVALLVEKIFIQPIRILIDDLLCDTRSKVWYTGPTLKLYET